MPVLSALGHYSRSLQQRGTRFNMLGLGPPSGTLTPGVYLHLSGHGHDGRHERGFGRLLWLYLHDLDQSDFVQLANGELHQRAQRRLGLRRCALEILPATAAAAGLGDADGHQFAGFYNGSPQAAW